MLYEKEQTENIINNIKKDIDKYSAAVSVATLKKDLYKVVVINKLLYSLEQLKNIFESDITGHYEVGYKGNLEWLNHLCEECEHRIKKLKNKGENENV